MAEDTFDKGKEVLFAEMGGHLKSQNYLGEHVTLDAMLRDKIADFLTRFRAAKTQDARRDVMLSVATSTATILLGENKDYPPVRNWNKPGGIDVFCAHWLGSSETDPKKRMIHCVVMLLNEIIEIAKYAGEDDVMEEQWVDLIESTINGYALTFLGMSPPAQALATMSNEPNGAASVEEQAEEKREVAASATFEHPEGE